MFTICIHGNITSQVYYQLLYVYMLFALSNSRCSNVCFILSAYDECMRENGGCEYNCTNTQSGYYCTCPYGYDLYQGQPSMLSTSNVTTLVTTLSSNDDNLLVNKSCVRMYDLLFKILIIFSLT